MRLEKIAAASILTLVALLGWQLLASPADVSSRTVMMASWAHAPESLAEAVDLADQIVVGKVVRVRQAQPIVIEAEGEPDGVHSVPVQAVTFQIEKTHKAPADRRGAPDRVEVFHTGGQDDAGTPIMLEGDPEYRPGQRYLLFLAEGPELRVAGSQVLTRSVIAPSGRYGIGSDGRLEPAARRGPDFSERQRGQPLEQLERMIAARTGNRGN